MSSRGWSLTLLGVLVMGAGACCPKVRYKAKVNEALKLRIQAAADLARAEASAFVEAGGGAGKGKGEEDGRKKDSSRADSLPDLGLTRNELENMVERATKDIDPVTADEVLEAIRGELGPTPEEAETEAVQSESEYGAGQELQDEPEDESGDDGEGA